jgi:hypothetical protein
MGDYSPSALAAQPSNVVFFLSDFHPFGWRVTDAEEEARQLLMVNG